MGKERKLRVDDNPKPLDRAIWQRLRVLVEEEAVHRDWGTALYRLHRTGRIDNDQRAAGDRYIELIMDYRKLWRDPMLNFGVDDSKGHNAQYDVSKLVKFGLGHVVADSLETGNEFEAKRARYITKRYKEARAVAGGINNALEDMLTNDVWPVGERGHLLISHALTRLSHFFATGTKRKR